MADYRDYGFTSEDVERPVAVTKDSHGQVYWATHEGGLRLPLMNRSFISFSYGGKQIEDFNLLATISGSRMEKPGYASFEDLTSQYTNLDGQQYWGTHYRSHTFNFTLSTDGIDQRMLDEFLAWFHAGEARELVLAEHPNRAILARVSEPPQLSMLPFEADVSLVVSGDTYTTKTTLFKGDIRLTLISDSPFWYSRQNVLGVKDVDRYLDQWEDANGAVQEIFASQDALKILYEDGLPLGSMIQNSMLLGDGTYANFDSKDVISKIWNMSETDEGYDTLGEGARIDNGTKTLGVISGAIIDASGNGILSLGKYRTDVDPVPEGYFFYAGTAPAFTIIEFTLTPQFNNNGYIVVPRNSHSDKSAAEPNEFNTLTIESRTKQQLMFTTPNVFTSYNKVIDILRTYITPSYSWEDIRIMIRDNVYHVRAREWAMKVIDYAESQSSWNNNGVITDQAHANTLITYMSYFLCNTDPAPEGANFQTPNPITLSFNSETGEATGLFQYRLVSTVRPTSADAWKNYGTNNGVIQIQKEDVGDMLRSNHIIIRERNYADAGGKIVKWTSTSDATKSRSHRIYHDVDTPLTKISVLYKNMYY